MKRNVLYILFVLACFTHGLAQEDNDTLIIGENSFTNTTFEKIAFENKISQPFPNPANSYVKFNYTIEQHAKARIEIYNIIGEKVRDLPVPAEEDNIRISLDNLASGVYIYSFKINKKTIKDGRIIKK